MSAKGDLLTQNGYRYNFYRMAYVNRVAKKVFSVEAIEDNPVEWLRARIADKSNGEWQFYFTEQPSQAVVRDFVAELDGRHATS